VWLACNLKLTNRLSTSIVQLHWCVNVLPDLKAHDMKQSIQIFYLKKNYLSHITFGYFQISPYSSFIEFRISKNENNLIDNISPAFTDDIS